MGIQKRREIREGHCLSVPDMQEKEIEASWTGTWREDRGTYELVRVSDNEHWICDRPDTTNVVSTFYKLDSVKLASLQQVPQGNKASWTTSDY